MFLIIYFTTVKKWNSDDVYDDTNGFSDKDYEGDRNN